MSKIVLTFLDAAASFCQMAGADRVEARWTDQSALRGLSVGGLVGHVSAGIGWIEPLLDTAPADNVQIVRRGKYFSPFTIRTPDDFDAELHRRVREQGERGGQRGATDTVAKLRSRVERLSTLLPQQDPDRLIDLRPTVPGAMYLDDFICTRIIEVVVHGDDLAVSVGLVPDPPTVEAATIVIDTLVEAARDQHGDLEVIRTLARGDRSTPGVVPVL